MAEDDDKLGQLLYRKPERDLLLERLNDVRALTEIIHDGRVRRARSSDIALEVINFVKEG